MTTTGSAAAPLAVVVCTYNRSASLIETLHSLYSSGYGGDSPIDVLVVANCCVDDTLARLEEFRGRHPQTLLRLSWVEEPTRGKSHAINTAIARTAHDALCFVDDDQLVEAGFLGRLTEGLSMYPDEDIFCGRIWPAWDGTEPSWVHAEPPYAIPIRPFPEFDLGSVSRLVEPRDRQPSGGNITIRRRVLDRVGTFSTDLGPTGHNLAGGEDHDFLRRAVAAGFRIRYLPAVRQLHAIDAARTRRAYILKKSYLRSRSSLLANASAPSPRLYMLRSILAQAMGALLSLDGDRRFYRMVRVAASLGELTGAVEAQARRRARARA